MHSTTSIHRVRLPAVWLVLLALLGGGAVLAQTPAPSAENAVANPAQVPHVYARNLQATVSQGNRIEGQFDIVNEDPTTVGDIGYEFLILGLLPEAPAGELVPDDAPVYDQAIQKERIALPPNGRKSVRFAYTTLPLPPGNYRFQVQLRMSNDRRMGWDEVTVPLLGNTTAFAVLEPQDVAVESRDVLTGEVQTSWDPLEGPNVNANQEILLRVKIRNVGSAPLTATPRIAVKRLLSASATPVVTSAPALTIAPGAEQLLTLPITTQTDPGAYVVFLSLEASDQRASSLAEFRYVVRGASASIMKAAFEDPKTKPGETATVALTVASAADRETLLRATATVAVLDGTEVAGTATVPLNFDQDQGGVIATTVQVLLTRGISDLGLRVTLHDEAGTLLDTYEASFPRVSVSPSAAAPRPSTPMPVVFVVLSITGVLVLALIFWLAWRNRGGFPGAGTTIAILLALGAGWWVLSYPKDSEANISRECVGCTGRFRGVTLFVNRPTDESIIPTGTTTLRVSVRAEASACINAFDFDILRGRVDEQRWSRLPTAGEVINSFRIIFRKTGGHASISYSGSVDIGPELQASADGTVSVLSEFFTRETVGGTTYTANARDIRHVIQGPDLISENLTHSPPEPMAGTSMNFQGTVKNQGGPAGASQTRLRIDVGNNGSWDVTPPNNATGALAKGATETETWSNVWTAVLGTHAFEICADATNVVNEAPPPDPDLDEDQPPPPPPPTEVNNCVKSVFTVVPLLTCTPAAQSAQPNSAVSFSAAGGAGTYAWTAPSGSPSAGTGSTFSTHYAAVGTYRVTVRSGQNTAECTVSVAVPTPTPGAANIPLPRFKEQP